MPVCEIHLSDQQEMRLSHFLSFRFVWDTPFCQKTADGYRIVFFLNFEIFKNCSRDFTKLYGMALCHHSSFCCFLKKGSIPHKPEAEKMRQTRFLLVA